jgi:phage head maturation protease
LACFAYIMPELMPWEVSLVTFPMNQSALVTGVKRMDNVSEDIREFREVLAECRKAIR